MKYIVFFSFRIFFSRKIRVPDEQIQHFSGRERQDNVFSCCSLSWIKNRLQLKNFSNIKWKLDVWRWGGWEPAPL